MFSKSSSSSSSRSSGILSSSDMLIDESKRKKKKKVFEKSMYFRRIGSVAFLKWTNLKERRKRFLKSFCLFAELEVSHLINGCTQSLKLKTVNVIFEILKKISHLNEKHISCLLNCFYLKITTKRNVAFP